MRAGSPFGELPVDHAREDVAAHRKPEHLLGQLDIADFLIVESSYCRPHGEASSPAVSDGAASAASGGGSSPAASRSAAGKGSPSGVFRLTASRISTQPFSLPGTEPLIRRRPRSASDWTTSRLCVVTRSLPSWPAIFLFLNVLPGDCRCPVEPRLRCETDTPWLARRPPKLCRFMPPAKPLPMLVPVISTYWPGTKCAAVISAPIATSASSETRNSANFDFGSTFAAAKWPRCGLVTFLTLAAPTPSCSAVYPSLSCVRCATTWQLSTRSTVTATWLPSSVKTRLMPSFFAIRPVLIAAPYSLISTST